MLHVFPHWNPSAVGADGTVDVWVYSNADEVELRLNGRSLGRKAMPRNGHLVWPDVPYRPGKLVATGYKNGKRVSQETLETTGPAIYIDLSVECVRDIAVVTARLIDANGRQVPDACPLLNFTLRNGGRILGGGNGDPAWHGIDVATERDYFSLPAFNGLARLYVKLPNVVTVHGTSIICESEGLPLNIIRWKQAAE